MLSKAISVALVDFLKECRLTAKIKWPNDIYINDKKITGILLENGITSNSIKSCIIGVGLNVNQKIFLSNAPNPTSILLELTREKELDREKSLQRLLFLFEQRYKLLMQRDFEAVEHDYLSNLYRNDGFYPYTSNGSAFNAKITGISNIGELLLETEHGENRKFGFKEIAFVI